MQLKYLGLLLALNLVSGTVNSEDIEFLTDFVNDFKSHKSQYLSYINTAGTVPTAFTALAVQVATYTDDSYTTLLDNSNVDLSSLKSYATGLPWYSRIADSNESGSNSDSITESGSSDSSKSSTESKSSTSSKSSSKSSSSGNGVSVVVAPIGGLLGIAAIALL